MKIRSTENRRSARWLFKWGGPRNGPPNPSHSDTPRGTRGAPRSPYPELGHLGVERHRVERLDQAEHAHRVALGVEAGIERVVRRLHVIGARRRDRVGERQALLAARVVHRQLLALHVEREALGALAEALRRALDALGEQVAEALAPADHVDEPDHGVGVADRKSTRLNSSHLGISYAVFCLKKK